MRYYCPRCRRDFPENPAICPHCGQAIENFWAAKDYVEKLILALDYPERDPPMWAALLLGELKDQRAVLPLIELIQKTADVSIALAAVQALGGIGTPEARQFLSTLTVHGAKMVRDEVQRILSSKIASKNLKNTGGMMNSKIVSVRALEILDSRGNPTLRAYVTLDNGVTSSASVPSGASTGENEAVELRDGDKKRYGGKGVLTAVENVNAVIASHLIGNDPRRQAEIDRLMIELDGTPNKGKLGANAILGVSMAVARAAAVCTGLPLYQYLEGLGSGSMRLPMPMMNIINGGKHADNSIDFQEFMIAPIGAPNFAEALRYCSETFHTLKRILKSKGYTTSVGDEGGFAPNLQSNEEACEVILEAIAAAGFRPGQDMAIALDPAASSFYADGVYHLSKSGQGRKTSAEMIDFYEAWLEKYPIVLIEDGLAENDWQGFRELTAALGDRVQIVGDDIFVTNTRFIERGLREKTANAALIKLNQIGTVTETIEAIKLCRQGGWGFFISHRSGETEDTFLADFAVAMGGGELKTGSVCRSERIAKYNRLLEIEAELGSRAIFTNPFTKS